MLFLELFTGMRWKIGADSETTQLKKLYTPYKSLAGVPEMTLCFMTKVDLLYNALIQAQEIPSRPCTYSARVIRKQ